MIAIILNFLRVCADLLLFIFKIFHKIHQRNHLGWPYVFVDVLFLVVEKGYVLGKIVNFISNLTQKSI
jgi:hypothetical protein